MLFMRANRSMPAPTVVPVLIYPDVREAVAWLSAAFGFSSGYGSAGTIALSSASVTAPSSWATPTEIVGPPVLARLRTR